MRYFSPRAGDNPIMVLGGAFRVGVHWVQPEHFRWMIDEPHVYCPRHLDEDHPEHRENCYLCSLYQTGRRNLRESMRYFWPVVDLSVRNPDEIGLQWFVTGIVNVEKLSLMMVGQESRAIVIVKEGEGLRRTYKFRDFRSRHPFIYTPKVEIDFPKLTIYSETQMGRLFVDPYTLDYPREVAESEA